MSVLFFRTAACWTLTWRTNYFITSTSQRDMTKCKIQQQGLFRLRKVSLRLQAKELIKCALLGSSNAVWLAVTANYYFSGLDFIPILWMTN